MTAVTVADVHAAEDNVFTTTVATSGSLPEHMLVGQHTLMVTLLHMLSVALYMQSVLSGQLKRAASLFSHPALIKLMFLIIENHEQPQCLIAL